MAFFEARSDQLRSNPSGNAGFAGTAPQVRSRPRSRLALQFRGTSVGLPPQEIDRARMLGSCAPSMGAPPAWPKERVLFFAGQRGRGLSAVVPIRDECERDPVTGL